MYQSNFLSKLSLKGRKVQILVFVYSNIYLVEFSFGASPSLIALLKMGSWLSAEEFSVKVFFV